MTIIKCSGTVNVRVGPGMKEILAPSSPWLNGEQVVRDGDLVSDGTYNWQKCAREKNRYQVGYIRNDFLTDK